VTGTLGGFAYGVRSIGNPVKTIGSILTGSAVGGFLGGRVGGGIGARMKRKEPKKMKTKALTSNTLQQSNSGLSLHAIQDTTLLGVPGDFEKGEARLMRRLQQLSGRKKFTVRPIPDTQHRAPLPGPLPSHPVAPESNPNLADDYLVRLKKSMEKRRKPKSPLKGFFPERGDIRDY
jgi:hypothetical protein